MTQLPTSETRARRFPLRLAVQYRPDGSGKWLAGNTENISCSGLLLRARSNLRALSPIEIALPVPRQLTGTAPFRLLCRGYVVRSIPSRLGLTRARLGVMFVDLRPARLDVEALRRVRGGYLGLQHQFNNQLAVILGLSDLLLGRSDLSPEVRDSLSRIRQAASVIAGGVRGL